MDVRGCAGTIGASSRCSFLAILVQVVMRLSCVVRIANHFCPAFEMMLPRPGCVPKVSDGWSAECESMLVHLQNGHAASALLVFRQADLSTTTLKCSFENYVALLSNASPRVDMKFMLCLMSELEKLVSFEGIQPAVYFARFSRWLVQELLAECATKFEQWERSPELAMDVQDGHASSMRVEKVQRELDLNLKGCLTSSRSFMNGDSVFITFPPTAAIGPHSLDAVVQSVWGPDPDDDEYWLVVKLAMTDSNHVPADVEGKTCRVDKVLSKATFRCQINALKYLCTPGNQMGPFNDIFLNSMHSPTGQEAELCKEQIAEGTFSDAADSQMWLNESQHKAASAALTQRLTLIQGPPGTGKTYCSVALVQSLVALKSRMNLKSKTEDSCSILACSGSNVAVDNLLNGFVKEDIQACRIGNRVRKDLENHSVEFIAKKQLGLSVGIRKLRKLEKKLLTDCSVVCATNVGAANGILEKMSFDTILMDEAAQATEPITLIPIVRAGVCRVILVGDHKQLPPTVLSKRAVSEGFSQSLFERLVAMQVQPYVLSIQYRMHPTIAAYPSKAFYDGRIRTGIAAEYRQPPKGFQWPSTEFPIAFCHVCGTEERRGNSYVNLAEGLKVESVLQALLQPGDLQQHDIGIISPYTSQVLNIKQRVQAITKGRRDGPVEVASIDGFQGREKEVIIVSTTRANKEGNLGFVKDFRRMNVTLTRAKRGIVVVGHGATLRSDTKGWGRWLQWIQSQTSGSRQHSRKRAAVWCKPGALHSLGVSKTVRH